MISKVQLNKITDNLWEIPISIRSAMRVPARVYASEKLLDDILKDKSLEQLMNVTTLPGIKKYALAMPDVHEGYGFPVGGVAAFSLDDGIISPGGIGYDINCGVRLLRSNLFYDDIKSQLVNLNEAVYRRVPSGVGRGGKLVLSGADLDKILNKGTEQAVAMGYGDGADLDNIESRGCLSGADASRVSDKAKARGRDQLGTIGAGNHFVEIDRVDRIFDEAEAAKFKIKRNQVMILVHTGSRGLGHQIATDYIRLMINHLDEYDFKLPDRELACAPFKSRQGQDYLAAMAAGANFAWANRQLVTEDVRNVWKNIFDGERLDIVYDVAHNIAKLEKYEVDGAGQELIVHRKGATRSFPGQPVIIPGSMGTASYLLVGQEESREQSFGSVCHGAGRRLSRTQAKKRIAGRDLKGELAKGGIVINAGSLSGLAEEAPAAYKDIDDVVEVVDQAGIAKKVARLVPLAVIKG